MIFFSPQRHIYCNCWKYVETQKYIKLDQCCLMQIWLMCTLLNGFATTEEWDCVHRAGSSVGSVAQITRHVWHVCFLCPCAEVEPIKTRLWFEQSHTSCLNLQVNIDFLFLYFTEDKNIYHRITYIIIHTENKVY